MVSNPRTADCQFGSLLGNGAVTFVEEHRPFHDLRGRAEIQTFPSVAHHSKRRGLL